MPRPFVAPWMQGARGFNPPLLSQNGANMLGFQTRLFQIGGSAIFWRWHVILGLLVAGATAGGPAYAKPISLLLEPNAAATAGQNIFHLEYENIDQVIGSTSNLVTRSQLVLGPDFSVGGFTHDGSAFHLILESNEDQSGSEVFYIRYNSLGDLLTNQIATLLSTPLNLGAAFDAAGFAATNVPEPGLSLLLGAGVMTLVLIGRRESERL